MKILNLLLPCSFLLPLTAMPLELSAQTNSNTTFSQRLQQLRSPKAKSYVWVAAHRGDWKYAPENSMEGLRNSLFFGADIIETDVRQTRDGHFIVMHNATVDRTTNGSGTISEMTLGDIRKLRLKTNWGQSTQMLVPTLEEYIDSAHGRAIIYLDKAGIDLPQAAQGSTVQALLKVLRAKKTLGEAMFVLDWPYEKARRIFGTALDSVIYCPVVDDRIANLREYVDEYIEKLRPVAFQFRMQSLNSQSYALLPHILKAGSRAFVAATWPQHTAGHDDHASIFEGHERGWGWLIDQGFSIIETNFPKDLIHYLRTEHRH